MIYIVSVRGRRDGIFTDAQEAYDRARFIDGEVEPCGGPRDVEPELFSDEGELG